MLNLADLEKKRRASAFGVLMADYSQNKEESSGDENPQEELLCEMLGASAQAKVFHWQTSSFAEHEALETFYSEFNVLMDTFIEAYQGCYGRMMTGVEMEVKPYTLDAPISFLESFNEYITSEARILVMSNSALCNILDEVSALCKQTIYRLTFK